MTTRRSMYWAAGGQVVGFLINFASSIIIARLLTPEEVGTYVVGAAFAGLCTAATAFNIGAYIAGESRLSRTTLDSAFTLNAILSIGLAIFLLAGSYFADDLLGSAAAAQVILVLAAQPILSLLTFRPVTMLHRDMHFRTISLVNVLSLLIGTIVAVGAAITGQGFMSQAWGGLATSVVGAVGFQAVGARYVSFRTSLNSWREISAFGLRMTTINGAAMATARLSEIILARMLGLHALGIFSRASNLSNQIFENVYGTSTRVAFAQLSKDFRETGEVRKNFLHSLRLITAVMCPVLAGAAVLSPVMIYILYGSKWLAVALPLSILLVSQIIVLGFGMNWELFVIRRETGQQTRIELFRSAISLVTFSIGCLFSVSAAALGRVVDSSIGFFLYRKHVLRLSEAKPNEFNKIFGETALLTVLAITPSTAVMIYNSWSPTTLPVQVACAILLGGCAWLIGLWGLNHPLAAEIKLLTRKAKILPFSS